MTETGDFFPKLAKILTVAELTRAIRGTLETRFGAVWVQGEISNYKLHPIRSSIFHPQRSARPDRLRDFSQHAAAAAQPLADGAQVQVYGNVSVFEARGQYQLSVQIVQTRGAGLVAGEIRGAQAQTGSGRIIRSRAQASAPESFPHASALSLRRAARRFATC